MALHAPAQTSGNISSLNRTSQLPARLSPDSILICRPNTRLGNTLLLTPLVQEIEQQLPGVSVEVLTAYPEAADVFREFPCVRRVHRLPLRGVRHPLAHVLTLLRARAQRYDLVLDPDPRSWSSRFAARLMRGAVKAGFSSTHKPSGAHVSVPIAPAPPHMARFPVYLLRRAVLGQSAEQALGPTPPLDIRLTGEERAEGVRVLRDLVGDERPVIALAAAATGAKRFAPQWWSALIPALREQARDCALIEIRPPSGQASFAQLPGFSSPRIRRVAAVIAACELFACADSGLMHLGAASGGATLGLFKVTDPQVYAPYGGRSGALRAQDDAPAQTAREIAGRLPGR